MLTVPLLTGGMFYILILVLIKDKTNELIQEIQNIFP